MFIFRKVEALTWHAIIIIPLQTYYLGKKGLNLFYKLW